MNQVGTSNRAMHLLSQEQIRGRSSIRCTPPLETAEMASSVPAPTSMPMKPSVTTTWRTYCSASRPQVGAPAWQSLGLVQSAHWHFSEGHLLVPDCSPWGCVPQLLLHLAVLCSVAQTWMAIVLKVLGGHQQCIDFWLLCLVSSSVHRLFHQPSPCGRAFRGLVIAIGRN